MNLKHISLLLLVFFSILSFNSCKDDKTESLLITPSANAQIYSFSLSVALNAADILKIDTINQKALAKTKFVIDQKRNPALIYNPDSLPYLTKLKGFMAAISFDNGASTNLKVIYKAKDGQDSIITWSSKDSIDFSKKFTLEVTAAGNAKPRPYEVDLRVHQIDPDTIIWGNGPISSLAMAKAQKTLLKGNTFYSYSLNGTNLQLSKWNKTGNWSTPVNVLSSTSAIILESITLLKDETFYAVDGSGKSYKSADGTTWAPITTAVNIVTILGVVPALDETKDQLAVIVEDGGKQYLAITTDMIQVVKGTEISNIYNDFPVSGFASTTNYDRNSLDNNNMLIITGGKTKKSTRWYLKLNDDKLQVNSFSGNVAFTGEKGVATIIYNNQLYALTDKKFYIASVVGNWVVAPQKQSLAPAMTAESGQSVIVDKENYIWVFGGVSNGIYTNDVWRGRLNKLNPKR